MPPERRGRASSPSSTNGSRRTGSSPTLRIPPNGRDSRSTPPAALRLRSLRVAQDEAYVYLRLDVGRIDWAHAHYQIGIDTYRRDLGDTQLPNTGSRVPVGLEFVLDLGGPQASEVLVDHPYNPYR